MTPMHFCCGVIMGYYYGESLVTGNRTAGRKAVRIPVVLHTLFDTAVLSVSYEEGSLLYGELAGLAIAGTIALSCVLAAKILKTRETGRMPAPAKTKTYNQARAFL